MTNNKRSIHERHDDAMNAVARNVYDEFLRPYITDAKPIANVIHFGVDNAHIRLSVMPQLRTPGANFGGLVVTLETLIASLTNGADSPMYLSSREDEAGALYGVEQAHEVPHWGSVSVVVNALDDRHMTYGPLEPDNTQKVLSIDHGAHYQTKFIDISNPWFVEGSLVPLHKALCSAYDFRHRIAAQIIEKLQVPFEQIMQNANEEKAKKESPIIIPTHTGNRTNH